MQSFFLNLLWNNNLACFMSGRVTLKMKEQFFQFEKSIDKALFLQLYNEAGFFSELFMAPFGFCKSTVDILGGKKQASALCVEIFHSWEDCFSRILYSNRGIPDSCIAASMHEFSQDREVSVAVGKVPQIVADSLDCPSVIELPMSCISTEQHVMTAVQVANMLLKLILALQHAYQSLSTPSNVSIRWMSPLDIMSTSGCLSIESLGEIVQALTHPDIAATEQRIGNSDAMAHIEWDNVIAINQFSTLLDIYVDTPEITNILELFNLPAGPRGLLLLRCGGGADSTLYPAAVVHPSIRHACLWELEARTEYVANVRLEKEKPKDSVSTASDAEHTGDAGDEEHKSSNAVPDTVGDAENSPRCNDDKVRVKEAVGQEEQSSTTECGEGKVTSDTTIEQPAIESELCEVLKNNYSCEVVEEKNVSGSVETPVNQHEPSDNSVGDEEESDWEDCSDEGNDQFDENIYDDKPFDATEYMKYSVRDGGDSDDSPFVSGGDSGDGVSSGEEDEPDSSEASYTMPDDVGIDIGRIAVSQACELSYSRYSNTCRISLWRAEIKELMSTEQYEEACTLATKAYNTQLESPVDNYLLGQLLTDRANCYVNMQEFECAEKDLSQILSISSHYGPAHACQSQLLLMQVSMGMLDASGDILEKIAKGALAAFLMGGSMDLELAGTAEEAAREVCRVDSKDIFTSRLQERKLNRRSSFDNSSFGLSTNAATKSSAVVDGTSDMLIGCEKLLPRSWFIKSFLLGYETLSEALQLDETRTIANYHSKQTDEMEKNEGENVGNEVTDPLESDMADVMLTPPSHLLDLDNVEGCNQLDREAYSLLRRLVNALESVYNEGEVECTKDTKQESVDENCFTIMVKEASTDTSSAEKVSHMCAEGEDELFPTIDNLVMAQRWVEMESEGGEVVCLDEGNAVCLDESVVANETQEEPLEIAAAPSYSLGFRSAIELLLGQHSSNSLEQIVRLTGVEFSVCNSNKEIAEDCVADDAFLKSIIISSITSRHSLSRIAKSEEDFDYYSSGGAADAENGENSDEEDESGHGFWSRGSSSPKKATKPKPKPPQPETRFSNAQVQDFVTITAPSVDVSEVMAPDLTACVISKSCEHNVPHCDLGSVGDNSCEPDHLVSNALRARLLNVCSSIAFLLGDAVGAVSCLRAAIQEDDRLLDSYLKLGCLLLDMDELEEASEHLEHAKSLDPKNPIVLMHIAELSVHENDFSTATEVLQLAKRYVSAPKSMTPKNLGLYNAPKRSDFAQRQLAANIYSLLGVSMFRSDPSNPEAPIRLLQQGVREYPESVYLLLCLGEILAQGGDMVTAMDTFKQASSLDPSHPLPYVNAARTYQQVNESAAGLTHLSKALECDPTLAMTYVDLAQVHMHAKGTSGGAQEALLTLEKALALAKHVSEIRDVLTAMAIAKLQIAIEEEGLAHVVAQYCFNIQDQQNNLL